MARTAVLNLRIEPEVKANAETLFGQFGLTVTDAVNVFLRQSLMRGGFPFQIEDTRWNDPESLAALKECQAIEANPSISKGYRDVSELIADCLAGDDDD